MTTLKLPTPLRASRYNRYDFGLAHCHNEARALRMAYVRNPTGQRSSVVTHPVHGWLVPVVYR